MILAILGGAAGVLGFLAEGKVISMSLDNWGVVMMKMTSRTNARSSKGVMFSSFSELWWPLENFFTNNNYLIKTAYPQNFFGSGHFDIKTRPERGRKTCWRWSAD